jgi:cytochrome oxidase assembly protein ShyY1
MYRFLLSPKWLAFHAICLAGVILMVNLGFWQLNRLDERNEFNAEVGAVIDSEPVPLDVLLADPGTDQEGVEWTPVVASGTYLADQIVVFNRSQEGQAGDNVLTALELGGGDLVLVNRGFITPPGSAPPAPPQGTIEILGRVRLSHGDGTEPLPGGATGNGVEVRKVEVGRLANEFEQPVLPVYLDLIASEPPVGAGDPAPVPAPELSDGPHLSYAIQWFIFATSVAVGWVFAVRASIKKHRAGDRRDEMSADLDEPAAVSTGSTTPAT